MEINLTQILIAFTEVIKNTQKLDLNNINIFTKKDGSKVTDFDIISDKILLNSLPNKLSVNNKNYSISIKSQVIIFALFFWLSFSTSIDLFRKKF